MPSLKSNQFPQTWDETSAQHVLEHYEKQTEEEAVAEDGAAWEDTSPTSDEVCKLGREEDQP